MNNEIEELSNIISENIEFYEGCAGAISLVGIIEEVVAKAIYDAGYHKQETCKNLSNSIDEFECSKCGYMTDEISSCKKDNDGEIFHYDYQFKFCPNCGAKIKGE